jgi:integrase
MSNCWIYQKSAAVKKLGAERAPYYVGYYEPDGRRKGKCCGSGFLGQKKARKLVEKIEAELLTGTYQAGKKKSWDDFRAEYATKVLAGKAVRTRTSALGSLGHFQRIIKPKLVSAISTRTVDSFIEARRQEPGNNPGSVLSPASVNHDLRHVKAALSVAVEWKYLAAMPRFRMEKEPQKLPTYVTGDDFASIYGACDSARMPEGVPNIKPADWWRGFLVMAYMTGWRRGDLLALRREDVDLDAATAISRAENNKGKRDERVKLHPVVVDHLRRLARFEPVVFPWPHNIRTLYSEFWRIQKKAGIHLACGDAHEHTAACHWYGFHDLRRAFATMNADKLTPDALQALMRHKSYQTTQRYINLARQLDAAVAGLHVPEVLRKGAAN